MRYSKKRMNARMPKTIFITSFHVLVSRNILLSPLCHLLKQDGWRIVIIVPEKKHQYFKDTFGDTQTEIIGVKNVLNRADNFFKDLALSALRTRSLLVMKKRKMGVRVPFYLRIFFFAPLLKSLIPFLYRLVIPRHSFHDIFLHYQPALVFSTDVFSSNDCRLMREAKTHGIKTVGMVRSWDNLTAKGGFRFVPDVLVVQNEIAKREAVELHAIPSEKVFVVGIPHYDRYLAADPNEEFYDAKLGVPRGQKFVLYAPLGDRIVKVGDIVQKHKYDAGMVALLDRLVPPDYFIIVRLPPTDTITVDRDALSPRVIFQEPGVRFGPDHKGIRLSEMSEEDDRLLCATLKRAAVVINPFSSLCIDAAFLDRPIITPSFDPYPVPYWESVRRLQEFEHFRPVMEGGGTKVVESEAELEKAIKTYMMDQSQDRQRRRLFAERECYKLDGRSSERLFYVLKSNSAIRVNQ